MIKKIKELSDFQKITLSASIISIILLIFSINAAEDYDKLEDGFYIFLKIVVCATMICLCIDKYSVWLKVFLIMDAILFNPIIQIEIEKEKEQELFDIISILIIVITWIIIFRKKKVNMKETSIVRVEPYISPEDRHKFVYTGLKKEDKNGTTSTR